MKAHVTEVRHPDRATHFHVTKNGRGVSHATAIAALKKAYPHVASDRWEPIKGRVSKVGKRKPFNEHASVYVLRIDCPEAKR